MADLVQDYTFELNGVQFGRHKSIFVDPEGFTPGDASLQLATAAHPSEHGTLPGRDFRGSATWGFDLHVDQSDPATALVALAELREAWWNEETEDTPGAFDTLRYRLAGRTRRVYGRARRWTPTLNNTLMSGHVAVTADFEVMDPFFYDDVIQRVPVSYTGAPPVAGIQAPLTAPLIGQGQGNEQYGVVEIGGTRPTWIIVTFKKSQVNPWVQLGGWRLQLNDTLSSDDEVVADSRPLARSILRNGTGRVRMSNTSRLGAMKLPPGRYALGYGALAADSSASVEVSWYNAHKSI